MWGQYGWPECKDTQACFGGKCRREHIRRIFLEAETEVSVGGQNARISKHATPGRVGGRLFQAERLG